MTLTINGKEFKLEVNIQNVTISKQGMVQAKGKKVQLKIKGTSEKPVWSSSNPKVAKVTKNGLVSCKKKGNAVITASFGEAKVGCAVSVVSAKKVKRSAMRKRLEQNGNTVSQRECRKGIMTVVLLFGKPIVRWGKRLAEIMHW